jgi:small subunit ribosomal protein S28
MAKMEGHENFPRAFKSSPLIQMGDPQGKIAEGTIVHIVDDDLYIDFGGKFNCVCPRPHKNGSAYTFGKKVRVMIHDLELSTRFLGAKSDLTILEADCSLLGLARREEFK